MHCLHLWLFVFVSAWVYICVHAQILLYWLKIMVVSYLLFKVMLYAALHHLTVSLHHIMLSIHGVFFPAVDFAQSCHLIAQLYSLINWLYIAFNESSVQ